MSTQTRADRDAAGSAGGRGRVRLLAIAAVLCFLMRVPGPVTDTFHPDQSVNGNLPHALLHGMVMPATAYQYPHHAHGSLVVAPIVTALFWLFGEYAIVMNLLLLAISTGIAVTWIHLADRYRSRRLAIAVAAVFVAGTPFWNYMSTHLWAGHTESCLFAVLQVMLLLHIVDREKTWPWALGLGLLAGLATLFSLHNVFTVGVTLAFWALAAGARTFAKRVLPYLAGLVAAFSPSIWFHFHYGTNYDYYRGAGRAAADGGIGAWLNEHIVDKLGELFGVILPRLPDFSVPVANALYMLAALFGLIVAAWVVTKDLRRNAFTEAVRAHPIETVVVLYIAVYVVVYAASGMRVFEPHNAAFYRYLMQIVPPLMVAIAIGFSRFGKAGVAALVALLMLSLPLSVRGPWGQWADHWTHPLIRLSSVRGYDLQRIYNDGVPFHMQTKARGRQWEAYQHVLEKTPTDERAYAARGYGRWLVEDPPLAGSPLLPEGYSETDRLTAARAFATEWTRRQIRGWIPVDDGAGAAWDEIAGFDDMEEIAAGTGIGAVEAMAAPYGLRAFASHLNASTGDRHKPAAQPVEQTVARAREIYETIPVELRGAFMFGLGLGVGRGGYKFIDAESLFESLFDPPDGWRRDYRTGIGRGVAERMVRFRYQIRAIDLEQILRGHRSDPHDEAEYVELKAAFLDGLRAIGRNAAPIAGDGGKVIGYRFAETDGKERR